MSSWTPTRPAPPRTDAARPGFDVSRRRVYCVGVGGCGLSGLARMLQSRGAVVSGSDAVESAVTNHLAHAGIAIDLDQSRPVPEDADLVVVSAAIPPDHPQLLDAQNRGIAVMTYAEALGACMRDRTGVAVAGTHGKSTTAAMLGVALRRAGLDPGVIVGATCPQFAAAPEDPPSGFMVGAQTIPIGARAGRPGLLVAEACEFNRSFHHLRPTLASIGAIEADHLDIYGSLDAVVEAFREFAALLPHESEGGKLLIGHEGAHRREVAAGAHCAIQTIGYAPEADWRIEFDERAHIVTLHPPAAAPLSWTLTLPGAHNAFNSAMAAALALSVGADSARVSDALSTFQGVDRRLQRLGERDGVVIYDDYGHHPTEIDATLRALRAFARPEERGGRLVCVFQPHQHSRTRFLLEEFAQSFSQADVVIVPHIYFVRDSEIEMTKVSARDLVDRLRERGVRAMHLYPFAAIAEQLEIVCKPGDLLVVMGAGPVWQVAHEFLRRGARAAAS